MSWKKYQKVELTVIAVHNARTNIEPINFRIGDFVLVRTTENANTNSHFHG